MDKQANIQFINQFWDNHALPTLMDYIKIPNKSPAFDTDWRTNKHMDRAVNLIAEWCKTEAVPNMSVEVIQHNDRTPVILIDVPGNNHDIILLYGHLDKQPEMTGWDADLHPWKPVMRGERLYGRGAADDGYAVFTALAAIKSLHQQNIPHARCLILIEACEESGSMDLPYYITALKDKLGTPSLVIGLDSGCGNYDQLWVTTSLRGVIHGDLEIEILNQGIHSGTGSGIVPSAFRILRLLLNRIENENTGDIILKELSVTIPEERQQQIRQTAKVLGEHVINDFPFIPGALAEASSIDELILRNTWKATLSVTGCDGFPLPINAGNVILPKIIFKLSMRLPPTCHHENALNAIKETLEHNPPYHAKVRFFNADSASGWNAPQGEPWLTATLNQASQDYFGKDAAYKGEGGTIPFMGMLGEKFPQAQFMITGVLGPGSNAHGPNEFLHIPTTKKLTACVAQVIANHYRR